MFEQLLLVTGALIFTILGSIHLYYTYCTDKFTPTDKRTADFMKSCSPTISQQTSMWKAWVGFNASHSIGAMLVGGFYIPMAIQNMDVLRHSVWLSTLPLLVSACYLILAKKYWFNIPFLGISLSTLCFALAAIAING